MIDAAQHRAALGAMCDSPRWFLWKLTPDEKKPGHYRKTPVNHDASYNIDHLAGQGLLTHQQAIDWCNYNNGRVGELYPAHEAYVVGYSMVEGCGFWFLDVDDAFKIDQATGQTVFNSPQAEYLYNELVARCGCAWEVSSSGLGFHVFGAGELPPHRKRNTPQGLELYTEGRGIAFSLTGQMGGNLHAADGLRTMVTTVAPHYFPYDPAADAVFSEIDFLNGPTAPEWRGPKDDDELIRRALQSQSTASKFGNAATFAQLWDNAPEGRAFYPGQSEMDMALAAQLAFWTGKDPQRMERLMLRSALVRDKWNERRGELTWLQHSIVEQCKKPMQVLIDKEIQAAMADLEEDGTAPCVGKRVEGKPYLTFDDQVELFENCCYVLQADAIFMTARPGHGEYLNKSKFDNYFGGYSFMLDDKNEQVKKSAWDAFTRSTVGRFPKADKAVFDPRKPPMRIFEEHGYRCFNSYVEPVVYRTPGTADEIRSYFFDFVSRLLPDANDQAILLYYMAALVQHQGTKFRWCPVIQGVQGNGKSTLANMLQYAVGHGLYHRVRSSNLTSKFNGWLFGKTLLIVDDVRVDRRDKMALEIMKPLITEEYAEIEMKGRDQIMQRVCGNFFMSMNDKSGVPRENNERRYAIFYCAQQSEDDVKRDLPDTYFERLFKWLEFEEGYAKVADWLATVEIPYSYNPAKGCQRAPKTSSEDEVVEVNRDELELVVRGAIETESAGFCGGFISSLKLKELAREAGLSTGHRRLDAIFANLGYIKHPHLDNGRPFGPVASEGGKKPTLYVTVDHPTLDRMAFKPVEVVRMYENANYGNHAGGIAPPEEIPPEYQQYNL